MAWVRSGTEQNTVSNSRLNYWTALMQGRWALRSHTPRFDLIIVGGGINGSAVARDASMRGLSVLLLEAADLARGASGYNGRMIHGGLRYLETGQIGLVLESLRERSILLNIAPHIVKPSRLIIPIWRHRSRPAWLVRLGLLFFDMFSWGRTSGHKKLSKKDALALVPSLSSENLSCALTMSDAYAECAERLTIENALSAENQGAVIKTYSPVQSVQRSDVNTLNVAWDENGERCQADARVVVNTTGAWADEFLASSTDRESELILKAKGTFIIADVFPGAPDEPVFFEAKQDRRPIIMTPWLGLILIGTTDQQTHDSPANVGASKSEIEYLLESVNQSFAGAQFDRSNILYTYTGVRPLPVAKGPTHKIARRHSLHRHSGELEGVITVLGGKLTTFRNLAEVVTDKVFEALGEKSPACSTAKEPLPGAKGLMPELKTVSEKTASRLQGLYGVRAADVLALALGKPELLAVMDEDTGAIGAEFVFAVRCEWARTLSDILLRPHHFGPRQGPGRTPVRGISDYSTAGFGLVPEQNRKRYR